MMTEAEQAVKILKGNVWMTETLVPGTWRRLVGWPIHVDMQNITSTKLKVTMWVEKADD